jgi:hypothetical protein
MDETSVELSGLLEEEKLKGVPVLIFANKQDLANAMSPDQVNIFFSRARPPGLTPSLLSDHYPLKHCHSTTSCSIFSRKCTFYRLGSLVICCCSAGHGGAGSGHTTRPCVAHPAMLRQDGRGLARRHGEARQKHRSKVRRGLSGRRTGRIPAGSSPVKVDSPTCAQFHAGTCFWWFALLPADLFIGRVSAG